jgi:hypothetical protein
MCMLFFVIKVNIRFWEEVAKENIPYPHSEKDPFELTKIHMPYSMKYFDKFL